MSIRLPKMALRPKVLPSIGLSPSDRAADRLSDLPGLKDNPGKLRALHYVPEGLEEPAPLVVVLHGCTQTAAVYDEGSGWSDLADRLGFILLFPEQQRANNSMQCFNWFSPGDTQRGKGEAASIRSMVALIAREYGTDPTRVFVTGLSAGGAMASVMLATYPDVFAGGAILAGLPYGCAADLREAFQCMGGQVSNNTAELGRKVRQASPHNGPWPRVQIWQGDADYTVTPSNADALVQQWAAVHGLDFSLHREDEMEGFRRRVWFGTAGESVIEQYMITNMGHGVPLASLGDQGLGSAGPHMLEVGLSSTIQIANFFGLAGEGQEAPLAPARMGPVQRVDNVSPASNGPQQVIERALRGAGLMR